MHDIFSEEVLAANYDYYEPRTQHGSSLSPSQYAIVAARLGRAEEAYDYFEASAFIDLMSTNKAVSGGTFIGGVHTAAAGGIWQLIVNGFAGMNINRKGLSFMPILPEEWDSVEFKLNYKANKLKIKLSSDSFTVQASASNKTSVEFKVEDKHYKAAAGEEVNIKI
jgi:kojibiose phosphorylase